MVPFYAIILEHKFDVEVDGPEEKNIKYKMDRTPCTNFNYKRRKTGRLQEESIRLQSSEILRDPIMLALLLNSLLFLFGLSVVFTHIAAYAESQGISASLGRALVSVIGGGALIGKIGLGVLSQIPCTDTFVLYTVAVALTGKPVDLGFVVNLHQNDMLSYLMHVRQYLCSGSR